jgi:large subunit ribosomal protein L31
MPVVTYVRQLNRSFQMKNDIHPDYVDCMVVCTCGNTIQTKSTKQELHTEICSACHPFFSGKQRIVDSAGRVERFQKRYGNWKEKAVERKKKIAENNKKKIKAVAKSEAQPEENAEAKADQPPANTEESSG